MTNTAHPAITNPENLILYRDALILVLHKPTGIPVHRGTGPLTPLDVHFDALRFGLPRKPELTHRLDKDTSGCLILGRHAQALRRVGRLFEKGRIEKTYRAIVHGHIVDDEGILDMPLGPQAPLKTRWWMKVDHDHGKPACTHFRVIHRFERCGVPMTFVELSPKTGRTHQLRVHCQAMGHSIAGDKIYGIENDPYGDDGLKLHAWRVVIPLYPKKDAICVQAPLSHEHWDVGGVDADA